MAHVLWLNMGDTEKAKEHHDKALKILETEPENVDLASFYADMAHMYYITEDMTKARLWAEKALKLAKKLNSFEVIASSNASLGVVFSSASDNEKALECFEKALKVALENDYIETALRAYTWLGNILPPSKQHLEYYQKGFELAKKVGFIGEISWFGSLLAYVNVDMGNIEKATFLAEESLALGRKTGEVQSLSWALLTLGYAGQVLGEWDKSERYFKEALSVSQKAIFLWGTAWSYIHMGWLHFEKGEYVKAREFHEKGIGAYEKAGVKFGQMWASIFMFVVQTYIELGEIQKAKNLLDNLHEPALEVRDKALIAAADALRGILFRAQKKWKESVEHFEKSLKEFEALDARRWNVYIFAKMVLCEYARVYLERDQKGDREKARNLLNQALEIFQKMGAKKDIERTRSKLAYLETGREMVEPEPVAEVSPRNYAVILTSPSCDERDLLIRKFLEAGAKDGQITFHIITKATGTQKLAELFQSNYSLFICNPEADAIIKSLPNVYKLKGVENLTDINIALTSAFRKLGKSPKGPRRACIEIVSDVLLQHHAVQTRRWLNALIPKLKSKGFTTLAVMDPEMHASQEVRAILDLFDGEISIYKKATEKGRFLKIEKMADQKYLESELHLRKGKLQT